jgi:cell division protein FtsQ
MSTATQRKGRGSGKVRRANTKSRARVREVSWLDKLLRAMPFSQQEVQHALTLGILGVIITAAFLVAGWFGVHSMIYRQFGELTAKVGFEVANIETTGMRRVDQIKVYDIVLSEMEKPMLLVDIEHIRKELNSYGWIKDVRVTRRLPDTLVISVAERAPVAVWQRGDSYSLLDDEGKVLDKISEAEIGNLTIIKGAGANKQIAALEKLLDNAQSLRDQVVGASWIGNRRWDLRFRSGETLALPEGEEMAAKALVDFTRMDGVHRLLGRDLIHFDLRDPDRAYIRKAPKAKADDVEKGDAGKSNTSSGGNV